MTRIFSASHLAVLAQVSFRAQTNLKFHIRVTTHLPDREQLGPDLLPEAGTRTGAYDCR
jgi:hypothetical protein